jgi:hypothetical protein
MNNTELKNKLHDIFKKYRDTGIFCTNFKDNLNQYYANPRPELYINRIKSLVTKFETDGGDERYLDYINEVKSLLNGSETETESDNDKFESESETESKEETKVPEPNDKQDDSINNETKEDSETEQVEVKKPVVKTSDTKSEPKSETVVETKKPVVNKPNVKKSIVKSKRTGKHEVIDLTPKTIKFTLPTGLLNLFDKTFADVSKSYLLSSGVLSDEEAMLLSEVDNNVTIYREHGFQITRSDMFIILILLGLVHLNVYLKDETINDLFDDNTLKIDFYNEIMNTNLVELDVQSRVRDIQKKLEKNSSKTDVLEMMLIHLLLERANIPKDQNRETVKKSLDTSSVMNQSMDAFSVLEGLMGSKLSSYKDYKRVRGE